MNCAAKTVLFYCILLFITTIFVCCSSAVTKQDLEEKREIDHRNHILILYHKQDADRAIIEKYIDQYGAEIIYRYENLNGYAFIIPPNKDITEAKAHFMQIPDVLQVMENQIYHTTQDQ